MNLRKYTNIARYALYDAGNSNYDTLVIALAFPLFLETVVVSHPDPRRADLVWGVMAAAGTILAAVAGPLLGALSDRWNAKFRLLRWMSFIAIGGTFLLAFLPPGRVFIAGALFVATHCTFLLAALLYNSALADVSSRANAAVVSSVAWGVGYLGGLAGLLIALTTGSIASMPARLKSLFVIASLMFLAFSLPLLLMRRRGTARGPCPAEVASLRLTVILRSFMHEAKRSRFFWAFFLYSNGVNTVIYFTSLFARNTLGFKIDGLIGLFIMMNIVAAPAAIVFGKIAEKFGQVRTLKAVVAGWIVVVILIALIGWRQDQRMFTIVACCAASLLGPVQALSRSLFRIIFPREAMSTYFGVQSLANRSAALLGPLLFGIVSYLTGSQIMGALSAGLLFAAGLAVLFTVPKGIENDDG